MYVVKIIPHAIDVFTEWNILSYQFGQSTIILY